MWIADQMAGVQNVQQPLIITHPSCGSAAPKCASRLGACIIYRSIRREGAISSRRRRGHSVLRARANLWSVSNEHVIVFYTIVVSQSHIVGPTQQAGAVFDSAVVLRYTTATLLSKSPMDRNQVVVLSESQCTVTSNLDSVHLVPKVE